MTPRRVARPCVGPDFDVVLEAAQDGADWGCTRIYQWLAPAVAGYLGVNGADDPDDVTNEVFLRVFSDCRCFSGNEAEFRAWVFTIAHSRLIDGRRRKNRTPEMAVLQEERLDGQGATTAGAEEEAMSRLALDDVERLLGELTSEQRDVITLRLIAQMSVEEVAMALRKPPGAVKALQRRALATLRRRLGAGGGRQ